MSENCRLGFKLCFFIFFSVDVLDILG